MRDVENVLIEQLPLYFRPILEFQEIMRVHGYAFSQADSDLSHIWDNQYIATCDEATVAYWENVLKLSAIHGEKLESRRQRVMRRLNTFVPFTFRFLKDQLAELYGADGYELSVDAKACTLRIKITSDRYGAMDLLYDFLWDILPAHLEILADQEVKSGIKGSVYVAGILKRTRTQVIHCRNVHDFPIGLRVACLVASTKIQKI